jgi:protease-4
MLLVAGLIPVNGCGTPKINLFQDATVPLREFTLEGTEPGKVLIIPVRGVVSDVPRKGLLFSKPSIVQEVVSQLKLAEKDKEIQAVLLKIDSPGGSTTASDILYHEINTFKNRTGVKVVAAMMGVATSGGYYISLPADFIVAHPTTVTGSIGVIFVEPKVTGLMEKIGFQMEVNKSGENKDMGSPFRQSTEREKEIMQNLIDELGDRFMSLVAKHRKLDQDTLSRISTARVYLAKDALELRLVDTIGYLNDALLQAKELAGLPKNSKVVVYRRTEYPDDNLYNTFTNQYSDSGLPLVNVGLPNPINSLGAGFYYLWLPASFPEPQ